MSGAATADPVDSAAVSALLARVARETVLPRFGRLAEDAVRQKSGPGDLVTEVDEEAEARLRAGLAELAPAATFVGEEAAAADPSIVAAIAGPGLFWIVDPLDGTRNFVRGKREFASIVALVENGRTRMGWIHAIPEGRTWRASAGGGVLADDRPVAPAPPTAGRPRGLRSTGWLTPEWRARLTGSLGTGPSDAAAAANPEDGVETVPSHCSAYAYLALVEGRLDFKLSSRIHPWDHAAGALMLEELGGATVWLDDRAAYTPVDSADRPLLAVAPGRSLDDVARRLLGGNQAASGSAARR